MQTTLIDPPAWAAQAAYCAPQLQHTMAQHRHWQVAACSSTGLHHLQNHGLCEDSTGHRVHPDAIALANGDGVSGGALGQEASHSGVSFCLNLDLADCDHQQAQSSLQGLDAHVQNTLAKKTSKRGATTLAAAWLNANGEGWYHRVGDCRGYHWQYQQSRLTQLLPDQTYTLTGRLPRAGSGIPSHNPSHMLGIGQNCPPELLPLALQSGDCLLLCSDGLHGFVPDEELQHLFQSTHSLARLSRNLLRRALRNGSDDDISVQLLRYAPAMR